MAKILIFLLGLVVLTSSVNWQAGGNWTSDNMTFIWKTLDEILNQVSLGTGSITTAPDQISTILNNQWHQAWNVAAIKPSTATRDAVVYGYAYNNHWFWVNNYGPAGFKYNIVIWKDYNCDKWITITTAQQRVMSTPDRNTAAATALGPMFSQNLSLFDDPWAAAKDIVNRMQTAFKGEAYSVVIQHGDVTSFHARVCYKQDYIQGYESKFMTDKSVTYLVFRTR